MITLIERKIDLRGNILNIKQTALTPQNCKISLDFTEFSANIIKRKESR